MEDDAAVRVFIESEAGTRVRKRFDEEKLTLRESFEVPGIYPYPYGFILGSSAGGRDALDCYVLTSEELASGSSCVCRLVGVLEMTEDGESDHKLLAALPGEEPTVDEATRDVLSAFIASVFSAFPEAKVEVGRILGRAEAVALLRERMG
jgi:inorganic pyrophosphatase